VIGVDNLDNYNRIKQIMEIEEINQSSLVEAGQKLLGHSKSAEFSAKRGLVVELFPFIFGAAERMSARAISRFLEKEQGIKLSSVTINKALKDPAKNWDLFFDMIEPAARVFEREDKKPMREFLFKETIFQKPVKIPLVKAAFKALVPAEIARAASILRGKWYVIDLEIRQKGRPYIEHRLNK
jgi:hypothetical protein